MQFELEELHKTKRKLEKEIEDLQERLASEREN